MLSPTELRLTVLVQNEGPVTVAQCLEYDIAVQGPTPNECKRSFLRMVGSQILRDLQALPQAPQTYFDKSVEFQADGPLLPVLAPYARPRIYVQFLKANPLALAQ